MSRCLTHGHVRVLTLDRPERRNALSTPLQAALIEELLTCAEDGEVRAIVLTGNGPAFCAGFDLKEIREGDQRGQRFRPPINRPTRSLFEVVTETPVPIVAALNGAAVAGGVRGRGVDIHRGAYGRRTVLASRRSIGSCDDLVTRR